MHRVKGAIFRRSKEGIVYLHFKVDDFTQNFRQELIRHH